MQGLWAGRQRRSAQSSNPRSPKAKRQSESTPFAALTRHFRKPQATSVDQPALAENRSHGTATSRSRSPLAGLFRRVWSATTGDKASRHSGVSHAKPWAAPSSQMLDPRYESAVDTDHGAKTSAAPAEGKSLFRLSRYLNIRRNHSDDRQPTAAPMMTSVVSDDPTDPGTADARMIEAALMQPPPAPEIEQPRDIEEGLDRVASTGLPMRPSAPRPFERPTLDEPPGADQVPKSAMAGSSGTDLGNVLRETQSVNTLRIQKRSPLQSQPYIRGYRGGQIYSQADGGWWFPGRQDLDTVLSKIDPTLVDSVNVIPGPYGLRYGPGFSFIDVDTIRAPRFQNAFQANAQIGLNFRNNGEQLYSHETFSGGASDWGFIFNFTNRTGNDYRGGNGEPIPASYVGNNALAHFEFDLAPETRVEFRYRRYDQTGTEFAGQFFDLNFLDADNFTMSLISEDPAGPWDRFRADVWYTRSDFNGDTLNQSKIDFNVINRVESALTTQTGTPTTFDGFTTGALATAGGRVMLTFGEEDERRINFGGDVRYLDQRIRERFDINPDPLAGFDVSPSLLPRAEVIDPGVFAELFLPITDSWTQSFGGRIDFVTSTADSSELLQTDTTANPPVLGSSLPSMDLDQYETLYSFYMQSENEWNEALTTRLAAGHAQRAPTPTERYADTIFIALIQNGFSRVTGDPTIARERAWQVDASANVEWRFIRARASIFHSWVLDYITYSANNINDPTGARLLQTINTDLATLYGGEFYGEVDLTPRLVGFGSVNSLRGDDQALGAPLFGIIPLEGRAGIRLQDTEDGERWGVEFAARIVQDQERIGLLRVTGQNAVTTSESRTPGFTTFLLRGYWNVNPNLSLVAGVENLFDKSYLEHLDLRLPDDPGNGFVGTQVLAPGVTPYFGFEWFR